MVRNRYQHRDHTLYSIKKNNSGSEYINNNKGNFSFRADLSVLPHNAKLHYNFANFLKDVEQQENAIKHYKEALQ